MLQMLNRASRTDDMAAKIEAIRKSAAMIEFTPDGIILDANENFLSALGYRLDEIAGQHHSMFVEKSYVNSSEYKKFWHGLAAGNHDAKVYKRIRKDGSEIWIQASYNPMLDKNGAVYKVVKLATDITAQMLEDTDKSGQIDAISKAQAVIEFELDGTIINANQNFLSALGYTLSEVKGQHHRKFVDPEYAGSREYAKFWEDLRQGQFQSDQFCRIKKNGEEIWIQASYNPILDMNGKPFKVVKFATDITEQVARNADVEGQLDAINKAQAVIEFELDGTIIKANDNFLQTLGYSLKEVVGRHHRLFVEADYAAGNEYAMFWADLAKGNFQSAEYKRIAKGGREIYIQASYNPIFDVKGRAYKVVKFATDVTDQVRMRMRGEHVRTQMESVAAGAEELNVSVKEIADGMAKSRDASNTAVDNVTAADETTQSLNQAAESMGGIVELIQQITEQINLLALNATIESARAGDAGRGFAVVANEVKNLATQAKSATDQISDEIDNVRTVAGGVVENLETIRGSIENVQEYVTASSSAVEQQATVSAEMSEQMQQAAAEAAQL